MHLLMFISEIDNCDPDPCTNGLCVDGLRTFSCDCSQTDYEGELCQNSMCLTII